MEDFYILDTILGKMGFSGYYDFLNCLRMSITNLKPELADTVAKEIDVHVLVQLILQLSKDAKK